MNYPNGQRWQSVFTLLTAVRSSVWKQRLTVCTLMIQVNVVKARALCISSKVAMVDNLTNLILLLLLLQTTLHLN